jgi:hypothetical protein
MRFLWLFLGERFGALLNLAGTPGFVRDCYYSSPADHANISVHTSDLLTIIRVNGLDLYFDRLSGKFRGIGINPDSSKSRERQDQPARAPLCADSLVLRTHDPIHSR